MVIRIHTYPSQKLSLFPYTSLASEDLSTAGHIHSGKCISLNGSDTRGNRTISLGRLTVLHALPPLRSPTSSICETDSSFEDDA